jgi:ABC-type dipeptide/oligopeptide/nickel transport system permease component
MKAWLARFGASVLILLVIFTASRALVRALPGDPLETLMAESGTTVPVEAVRAEMGLDRPFFPALVSDLTRLARHGDLGTSLISRQPVAPLLAERFARTAELAALAFFIALLVAFPLALAAAAQPSGFWSRLCDLYGGLTAALPTPWIGPMLLVLFAVKIPLFPVGGHIALPALTLAIGFSGLWARLIRERVADQLQYGSATGARARGLSETSVLLKHGFAPVAGAIAAYLFTQLGALLAGAFVTETLFDWRGMGSLLIDAVLKRDYPVVEAGAFVAAAASLGGTLLGDWAQKRLDPRRST